MAQRFAYVKGRIVPVGDAAVSIADRGFLYGDGLFETMRVKGGQCVRLDRHLARLTAGARVLGIEELPDEQALAKAISSVLDANGMQDARVRLTVTRGVTAGPGILAGTAGPPTIVITANDLPSAEPEPARVIISSIRRDELSPLSSIKSLNYLPGILAIREAQAAGADDAILLNTAGNVAEGTVGNLFLVNGSTLMAPSLDQGVLPGTVRAAVIELASEIGLEVVERAVSPGELAGADELFFTNAIQLARPIRELGGVIVGNGTYPISRRIRQALADSE